MPLEDMAIILAHRLQAKIIARNILPRFLGGAHKEDSSAKYTERNDAKPQEQDPVAAHQGGGLTEAPSPRHTSAGETNSSETHGEEQRPQPPEHRGELTKEQSPQTPTLNSLDGDHSEPSAQGLPSEQQLHMEAPSPGPELAENAYCEETDEIWDGPLEELIDETFEAEQAIRNTRYCTFDPEAAEDYTDGPCRWTIGHDGVKDCVSLLIPFWLSQKIQAVAMQQRRYSRRERQIVAQVAEIRRFLSKLKVEIRSHKFKIEGDADYKQVDDEVDEEAVKKWKSELEAMEEMLEESTSRKAELESDLQILGDYLRTAQTEITVALDEAFAAAMLLEPQDDIELPVERLDLQEEYQKFCAKREATEAEAEADGRATPPPIDTNKDFLAHRPPTPTAEQQRGTTLRHTAQEAVDRLGTARYKFDSRMFQQEQERQGNLQAWHNGTPPLDIDTTAFDTRWLRRHHEITRELIEAEEAVLATRKAAGEAGIDVLSITPSVFPPEGFPSHPADGRCWSGSDLSELDGPLVPSISAHPGVVEWLHRLEHDSETDSDQHRAGAMALPSDMHGHAHEWGWEWEWDGREVEIWDSASLMEERPYKRKLIDQWQRDCASIREP